MPSAFMSSIGISIANLYLHFVTFLIRLSRPFFFWRIGEKRRLFFILSMILHTTPGHSIREYAWRPGRMLDVSGTAADLVKTAMVGIESRLAARWPSRQPFKRSRLESADLFRDRIFYALNFNASGGHI